ncbi:MAG: hypothetical protein EA356_17585 [Geminicoccaceae bacterium]|nr:MAG: hypothetical protein EA356_17585 [Geminicoccaceae bacterium]
MNPTKFARDHNGASVGVAHWKWGSRQVITSSATSSRTSQVLSGHMVYVAPAANCHVRLGASNVVAAENDPVLRAGAVYCFPRAVGETHVAVRTVESGVDGLVEVWEADSYREA